MNKLTDSFRNVMGFPNPWILGIFQSLNECLFDPSFISDSLIFFFFFISPFTKHLLRTYYEKSSGAVDGLQSSNFDCKKWLFTVIKSSMLRGSCARHYEVKGEKHMNCLQLIVLLGVWQFEQHIWVKLTYPADNAFLAIFCICVS